MQVSEHASWSSKYYGRIISAALAAVGEAWLPAASIYTAQACGSLLSMRCIAKSHPSTPIGPLWCLHCLEQQTPSVPDWWFCL